MTENPSYEQLEQKIKILEQVIAQREDAEVKLRDQKKFLERIIESLTYPFYVIDVATHIVTIANSAACEESAIGRKTCHALHHKQETPCDNSEHPCPLSQVQKTGKPVVLEHLHYDRDGKPIFVEVYGYPIFNNNGDVAQMIEYCIDITERKKAEERIKKYAENQGVLLREINHRVKNNLTAIIGMLQKETSRPLVKDDSACKEILQGVTERIESLAVIHSLLSASGWQPLLLSEVCEKLISGSLRGLSSDKKISANVNKSDVKISSNQAHHLTLVINELITNTIKHATRVPHLIEVEVKIKKENHTVSLTYKDNGPGYPEDITKATLVTGTVGMNILQGIVRKSLGGEVFFNNDSGAKAIVTFTGKNL